MTTSDRATIDTRFTIETPAWGGRADVVLFDGLPGGERAPVEVARRSISLDGSTAVIAAAPRTAAARVRRVFDGAVHRGVDEPTDPSWGRDAVHAVWVWLELDRVALAPGPVHAHLELPGEAIRELDIPAAGRQQRATTTRLPLWIDDQLRGLRNRVVIGADGASLADRFVISVANLGDVSREVWIEERLRPAKRRAIKAAWPATPAIHAGVARTRLTVAPGATARTGYLIEYVF